jgi:hypothetical protein
MGKSIPAVRNPSHPFVRSLCGFVLAAIAPVLLAAEGPSAKPPKPGPTWEIVADVVSVEKTKQRQPRKEPWSGEVVVYYRVHVGVLSARVVKGTQYERNYPDGPPVEAMERDGLILWPDRFRSRPISAGQQIVGRVERGGDERFSGFYLEVVDVPGAGTSAHKWPWWPLAAGLGVVGVVLGLTLLLR